MRFGLAVRRESVQFSHMAEALQNVTCGKCGFVFPVTSRLSGRTAVCSNCHKPTIVPGDPKPYMVGLPDQVGPSPGVVKFVKGPLPFLVGLAVLAVVSWGRWTDVKFWQECLSVAPVVSLFAVGLALYLIPTFIARARNHKNKTAITALNIIAGWTFAGWVVALVWALKND